MLDIRLEGIKKVRQSAIEKIDNLKKMFVQIDGIICTQAEKMKDNPAGLRAASLARTHLEIASMYTSKTLAILGEIKDDDKDS